MIPFLCALKMDFSAPEFLAIKNRADDWINPFPNESEKYLLQMLDEEPSFKGLLQSLNFLGSISGWMMKIPPHEKIRWHIDHNRECSIVLPLSDKMFIQFWQNGHIFEQDYNNQPHLLNVKIKHRVLNSSDTDRVGIYISIHDLTFDEARLLLMEKGMTRE